MRQVAAVFFQHFVSRFGLRAGHSLAAAQLFDGGGDAVAGDACFRQDTRHICVSLRENGEEDVFGGDEFVLQAICIFIGQVDNALDARGDEHLASAAAINGCLRAGAEHIIETLLQQLRLHLEQFQNLRDDTLGLLEQRKQNMLGIHLVVSIALQDLVGAGGRVLSAFGKTVKSHHRR